MCDTLSHPLELVKQQNTNFEKNYFICQLATIFHERSWPKRKSAIHLARVYGERKRNFAGQHFWARGYFVSTVGCDEATIREYIRN
jgi:REP element-mobilizing transposase RayT